MKRVHSIDIVRGIVMIIMALDHTRDLFHWNAPAIDPVDLTKTTPILFFTRIITHLCAPTFVFLSGVSAYLSMRGKNDIAATRSFPLKRGLWLILLELTFISFGIFYDIHFSLIMFQVIGAIGFGFVLLALLINLSSKTIGIIGLVIIFLHNALTLLPQSGITQILTPLFGPAFIPIRSDINMFVAYPPIPWAGILFAGFGFGRKFRLPSADRKQLLLRLGLGCLAGFTVLRLINIYGDGQPWQSQPTATFTILSFFNVQKYPPSLIFDLLFLGIMFILLWIFNGTRDGRASKFVQVYGSVPMFYYLLHWHLLHIIMFALVKIQGYSSKDYVFGFSMGRPAGPNGVPLWGVYVVWICAVLALYPLCAWYSRYKLAHKENQLLRYI